MIYNTWFYFFFVLITLIAYWWIFPHRYRYQVLLLSSLGLFLYVLPRQVLFIFTLATLVYIIGEVIVNKHHYGKLALIVGVAGTLCVLGYFKYGHMLAETLNRLVDVLGGGVVLELPRYALPLGISFFTFRFIHYLVDAARGRIPERSYSRFLMYTFFFPIMPSGPIERYQAIDEQLRKTNSFNWENITTGTARIIWGLFKKIVLADSISFLTGNLTNPEAGTLAYWAAMYAYTLKIYWDFSGYSDIAIGTARLFGLRVMENFNNPYFQTNISKFWKCWHMSLTGWFKDYLFIPLGGSRGNLGLILRNTLIVMAATGIWHGAAWHFMFWGLYHAAGLILLRLYNMWVGKKLPHYIKESKVVALISMALTFNFVAIGWIFFVVDVKQAFHILKVMFTF